MKKPQRPFAARIPFDDKTRLAIGQALDRREDLDLSWISLNVLGRNHAYLFQYLFKRTPRVLDYADTIKLAHFLNLDGGDLSPDLPPAALSDPYRQTASKPGMDSIPIYGATPTGDAILIGEGVEIGRTAAHPLQKNMKGAFAFYAVGESMMPRYRPGELVYAVTSQPPVQGQDCVIEMQNGEGYLRQFERRSDKDILCRRLHPSQDDKYAATEVKAVHAVVGRG